MALDDVPPRLDPELDQERHDAVQDLGDAAANSRRVHVLDANTCEMLREASQLADDGRPHDRFVAREGTGHFQIRSSMSATTALRSPSAVRV